MTRTSITHPLTIAVIRSDLFSGEIGVTFAPGKRNPSIIEFLGGFPVGDPPQESWPTNSFFEYFWLSLRISLGTKAGYDPLAAGLFPQKFRLLDTASSLAALTPKIRAENCRFRPESTPPRALTEIM